MGYSEELNMDATTNDDDQVHFLTFDFCILDFNSRLCTKH